MLKSLQRVRFELELRPPELKRYQRGARSVAFSDRKGLKKKSRLGTYSGVVRGAPSTVVEESAGVRGSNFRFRFSSFLAFLAKSR